MIRLKRRGETAGANPGLQCGWRTWRCCTGATWAGTRAVIMVGVRVPWRYCGCTLSRTGIHGKVLSREATRWLPEITVAAGLGTVGLQEKEDGNGKGTRQEASD